MYNRTILFGGMILYIIYLSVFVPMTTSIDGNLNATFSLSPFFIIVVLFAIYVLISSGFHLLRVKGKDKEGRLVLGVFFLIVVVIYFVFRHSCSFGFINLLMMIPLLEIQDYLCDHFKKRYQDGQESSLSSEKKANDTKLLNRITSFIINLVNDRHYNRTVFGVCLLLYLFNISGTFPLVKTINDIMNTVPSPPILFSIAVSAVYLVISVAYYCLQRKEKYGILICFFVVSLISITGIQFFLRHQPDLAAAVFMGKMRDVLFVQGFLYLLFWVKKRWKIGESKQ